MCCSVAIVNERMDLRMDLREFGPERLFLVRLVICALYLSYNPFLCKLFHVSGVFFFVAVAWLV